MSDVINSIFGRAQNETPSSESYEYGTTATDTVDAVETVDADAAEPSEPAEVEDTAEVSVEDDAAEAEDDEEAVSEEDSAEETEEAAESEQDTEEAVSDEAEAPVVVEEEAEAPVAVAEETEEAARPAAGSRGSTTVADGVVSKIVIRVARAAEGVHELDEAGTSVEVDGEVATIAVTLVVEFGRAVKTLAEQIRVQVIEAVEEYLGLEVATVDVHVADIHFPEAG
ncbi:Asp23/Gls24 family envelope stress response protein [Amycolatopsis sp. NPDC101161]|uniref:Asp23/Gls24 family envelope stress response protein n=1 Tax=Amycolatopsis sp. NPDC101161 TaxID=3363940 RepID=UPI0037FC9FCB